MPSTAAIAFYGRAAPDIPGLSIKGTIGAGMVGLALSFLCYGVTVLQVYIYYHANKDNVFLRSVVAVLMVLDTFQSIVYFIAMWHFGVENYLNPIALSTTTWSLTAVVAVTILTELLVRGVYCHRVWRLSKGSFRVLLVLAVSVFSILNFVCGLYYAYRGQKTLLFLEFGPFKWAAYASFSAGVMADCLLAGTLVYLLRQRRTGFANTESIISLVTRFTINTGILTSSVALAVLIAYAASPNTFIFIGIYGILSKVYANSMLALLNGRRNAREQLSTGRSGRSIHLSQLGDSSSTGRAVQNKRPETPVMEINVETTTWKETERGNIIE